MTVTTDPRKTGASSLSAGEQTRARFSALSTGPVLTAFVGDSLTNSNPSGQLGPKEYYTHAIELSGGAIMFAGKFGQGGMGLLTTGSSGKTWAQTKADLLAASPQPQRVVLLIGTNDLGNSFASVRDAYIQAIADLQSYGYDVVVSELTPRNDVTTDAALRLKLHTFNTWINRYARVNGLRCMHMYSAGADIAANGQWTSGYNVDSIHPGVLGAKAMGAECWAALGPNYQWKPYLVMDNGDLTGLSNGCMLTDAVTSGSSAQTASDGIPDNWGKANTMPASYTNALISAGSEAFGNWWRQVRDTASGAPIVRSVKIAANVGDVIQLGYKLKTSVPDVNGSGLEITLKQAAGTAWTDASIANMVYPTAMNVSGQAYSVDGSAGKGVFHGEFVVSAVGTAGVFIDHQTLQLGGTGGSFYLGQVTLRNLTALGIA